MGKALPHLTGGKQQPTSGGGPTQPYSLPPLTGSGTTAYSTPPLTAPTPAAATPTKKKHGHGFLHRLGSDLYNAAVNAPAGIYEIGHAAVHDATHPPQRHHDNSELIGLLKGYKHQVGQDVHHPLRHPGNTLLDALPVAGAVGKVADAGLLAREGASAGEIARAATIGAKPGPRTLKAGDLEVRGHYSRAAGSRLVQRATDTALQKGAERGIGTTVGGKELSAEKALHGRMAKWMSRNERVNDAIARSPGTRLQKIGENLSPAELRAIRLVAEQVPVERRIAAQTLRKAAAKDTKEIARHQERIDLTRKASEYLTEGANGKPVFKTGEARLKKVYGLLQQTSKDREEMLRNVGVMDEAQQQAAKVKAARFAAGAKTVAGEVVGGDGVTVSPDAPFIGNPVERTKLAGRPKISSTGTFGHTRRPGSLKQATGGSVEHALERNDVTQIAAERHAEAVRLSKIDRVRTQLAKAGTATPTRANDVWVWTDKLTRNERIPKDVRQYLDNPESIQQLPEHEQTSIREKLRQAVFEQHNWQTDAEKRAAFEKLAAEGKGVFVPRKLAGEYAKREVTLPGASTIDAVNNAQKTGLIYAKLNYPVVQGLSNVAMNLIHQGFAAPKRLADAHRLDSRIGPDMAAVVDDIMGQGAVPQAALVGKGTVARMSQKLAEKMTRKVDQPARRAAFLHEAVKAGYGTPEKLTRLVTDPRAINDLHEVTQRAKEAIVDYEDLGPTERAIVRRMVFVYPWQKGATKYAAHFLRDHPVQAAALGNVGERGTATANAQLGPVPSYLDGVFPAGGGLVNPAGVNFFQTPAQIGLALAGLATGNPAEAGSGQGFLSPAPGVTVGLLTGRNDIGQPLKGNLGSRVRDLTVGQTPASALAYAATGGRSHAVLGGRGPSKTFPNPNDALWRFLFGGLYPRDYVRSQLNKNAALQKSGR